MLTDSKYAKVVKGVEEPMLQGRPVACLAFFEQLLPVCLELSQNSCPTSAGFLKESVWLSLAAKCFGNMYSEFKK